MNDDFIYYTFQGDFTLVSLENTGCFSSTRDNNYKLIDLVKNHFNSEGIVYYFKVRKDVTELPESGREAHLIKLKGDLLSENRIEFIASKFSKALMLCDALSNNRYVGYSENVAKDTRTIDTILTALKTNFGVDFEFFKDFGRGESDVYVGLVDKITNDCILEIVKDYRK